MNRPYEFKIWDYTNKKMITSKNFKYFLTPKYGEDYKLVKGKSSLISSFFSYNILKDKKRFKILQFIGTKDINGKNIFDFDLVENIGGLKGVIIYDEKKCKYVILWENNCYSDILNNIKSKGSILENKTWLAKFRWLDLKGV